MRSDVTPIIPGFFPDPTVCRVGADYYLANSSFEYFPGAPLWHSRDLVTWEQLGNILTTREQFAEGESLPSKGIYGSTLRFHDGVFYFITTNCSVFERGQVIVTAADPRGPWSAPVYVPGAVGLDPDIAWDEDGTCLLTWKLLDFANDETGIRQVPIDPATGELLGTPYPLWQGTGGAHPEGPHLYNVGDYWYLLLAEGGTERGHMVTVARAPRPQGPFEPCPANPILTRRSTAEPVQSVGHADLVETPDGWAMVHLGTRPAGSSPGYHVLGRETFIAAVTWEDGWPVVDSGGWEIPPVATAFTEDFDGPTLGPRWVVPSGDLAGPGGEIPAGRHVCVRPRDLRWVAQAAIAQGGLEVRIDPAHGMGLRVDDGRVSAFMRIAGITTQVASRDCRGEATLRIAAVDPLPPDPAFGGQGPDAITLVVNGEEIARLDGRYLSTEVASGFTGRVIALGDPRVPTRVARFSYSA